AGSLAGAGAVRPCPRPARLLDFGAGRGELLQRLRAILPDTSLMGADFLPRPGALDASVAWRQGDLNDEVETTPPFDLVICSEVIEHLENPRATFRMLHALVAPGGHLLLTMPNQESLRSFASLLTGGHFVAFRGQSYPAHITALLRQDLVNICAETGFAPPTFSYTDRGGLPKRPQLYWQSISFNLLRGRLFSDNILMVARRPA
ncbi:MAG: methyltransferase domain-containing protein, partial [Sphingomonadales bacterium]